MFILVQVGVPCKWAHDSQRLLLEWFDTIHKSPSQVYHHALPLCPPSSWLHKCYAAQDLQVVKVVKGFLDGWGTCTRTVALASCPQVLTCWKDTIAVALEYGDITILDGITGSQIAILSGHTRVVRSLAFLPDGTSLVSGSDDSTIKLWDMQTGGIVKTFCGHTDGVHSVSISADCTLIASGSEDRTIHLWNIQTGECSQIIEQQDWVEYVRFSPATPHHLISVSGDKVWHWDIDGYQTKPAHDGSHIAFSLDGTRFVFCQQRDIVVQNTDSGAIMAKFHIDEMIYHCCLSTNGKLIAVVAGGTLSIWDTTSLHPHPIKTLVGHTDTITSIAFSSPSSLISSSYNTSVKFWQIGVLQTDPVVTSPFTLALIASITLQAEDGIAISRDSQGVVNTWDISTGLCNASFKTPATAPCKTDVQLVNGRLIFSYYRAPGRELCIWDVEKEELLQTIPLGVDGDEFNHFKVSKDGSRVVCLFERFIGVWSIRTGKVVGKVFTRCGVSRSLTMDGSGSWIYFSEPNPLGWDFGIPDSPPVQLSPSLHPNHTNVWEIYGAMIKDTVTGRVIFQLAGRFTNPTCCQWDGQYLVAGYYSGEVLILDLKYVLPYTVGARVKSAPEDVSSMIQSGQKFQTYLFGF